MKRLVIVTATTDPIRARACMESWGAADSICIANGAAAGGSYLGTVAAFRKGVDEALALYPDAEVIACLHDDLEIQDPEWGRKVLRHFDRQPACGLLGFGGAIGLGHDGLYLGPYNPMKLARIGFRSNLVDAEQHGVRRNLFPERVACLDGFSQIGRRAFWAGRCRDTGDVAGEDIAVESLRPWTVLDRLGIIHHFYDGCLGCLARRYGWETWYLPIACHHFGGRTAVGDPGYQQWAVTKTKEGDHGFWEQAHKLGYDEFRDVLPLRV